MSDEKSENPPRPPDEATPSSKKPEQDEKEEKDKKNETEAADDGPPSQDEVLQQLRTAAPELAGVRFNKIISERSEMLGYVGNINLFQGDFRFEGGFTTGTPGSNRPGGRAGRTRIEPERVARENEYYVRPDDFRQGVDMLSNRNLLFLSGQHRTGRYSRACATLLEVLRNNNMPLDILDLPSDLLSNMSWRVPEPRCGLLVIDRPNREKKCAAESMDETWLAHASDQLLNQGSFLVVVTGPVGGSLTTAPDRGEFVLEGVALPDPMAIVHSRITSELPGILDTGLREQLSRSSLASLFEERDDPTFAVTAAIRVIAALRTNSDLEEAIRPLGSAVYRVHEWLSDEPKLAEIAVVLATAVLEGTTYLNITDAATALNRRLHSSSDALSPRYWHWLSTMERWIVHEPRTDDAPARLRFKHPEFALTVLAMCWFELDGARDKIQHWLTDLADHSNVEVRAGAAWAAGMLATDDFEHSMHRYFTPWGAARSLRLRQSAAHGLNVATNKGKHVDAVWSHLERWACQPDAKATRNLAATAGLAVGAQLGSDSPDRALRLLGTLLREGDWGLVQPVAVSTYQLIVCGWTPKVLAALLTWSKPETEDEILAKVLSVFAFAALPDDGNGEHSVLLYSTRQHRDTLPELWGRAIDSEPVRPLAMSALRSWVRAADREPTVRDELLSLLGGIAERSDGNLTTLHEALHEWATEPDDPSDAALEFYNDLIEAGALIG